MRVAILIPARYSSSRLPAKPLLRETGKYLIQHVYERAVEAKCGGEVIVATDDERIFDAVREFGGRAVMTRADHQSPEAAKWQRTIAVPCCPARASSGCSDPVLSMSAKRNS